MSNQLCLLCLQIFDTGVKSIKKIKIETLSSLLAPNYKSAHQSDLDKDEMCDVCADCYPLFNQIEEIKGQISLLEEEVGSKVGKIRSIFFDTSSQLKNNEGDNQVEKIARIRSMIFRMTGEQEHDDTHFISDKVQVKVEYDEEVDNVDVDPLGDMDDHFFHYDYSPPSVDKVKEEETNFGEEDDDNDFCITPCSVKKLTSGAKNRTKSGTKRKITNSSTSKQLKTKSKRIKLESARRSSSRVKKQAATTKRVIKTGVVSSKINAVSTKSNPIPDSESSQDSEKQSKPDKNDIAEHTETNPALRPRPHKCSICSKSYLDKCTLTRHMQTCRLPVACMVPFCTVMFRSKTARDAHLAKDHDNMTPLQCRICNKKCRLQNQLAAHMVMRHENGDKNLSCAKCGKRFCLEENLARHVKLHDLEGVKPLVCAVCDDRFEDEDRLKKHMEILTHTRSFKCDFCDHRCSSKSALEIHLNTHTREKLEKCLQCDAILTSKRSLRYHMERMHPVGPAPYICHICGKGYRVSFDFKFHMNQHEGKTLAKCDTCSETFNSLITLRSHRVRMHGCDPFVCEECGATFESRSGLAVHKNLHSENPKKYLCNTCGTSFTRKDTLNKHIKFVHMREPSYRCPHCEEAFKHRHDLRVHVNLTHTPGYVPPVLHKCPHCDKGFERPSVLTVHIRRVHTGERPFSCDQCGRAFEVTSLLNRHLKRVHGVVLEKKAKVTKKRKKPVQIEEDEGNDAYLN